jgi:hypothetical protein
MVTTNSLNNKPDANRTQYAVPVFGVSGALGQLGPLTDGQLIIGSTGNNPSVATITAGTNISVTNGAGAITIASTGASLPYTEITTATQAITTNNAYGANRGGGVAFSLPATSAIGTLFEITGIAGLWSITQAAGQQIKMGNTTTTLGAGGSLTATDAGDCIRCKCIVADTIWRVMDAVGNLTVV